LMDEAHALVKEMLASHEPLPLPQEVERELLHLEKQAEFEG
jgi:hypothetical protein